MTKPWIVTKKTKDLVYLHREKEWSVGFTILSIFLMLFLGLGFLLLIVQVIIYALQKEDKIITKEEYRLDKRYSNHYRGF